MIKITLIFFLFSFKLFAADQSKYMEIARERSYKGGADESDLKVHAVIYQTLSKKKKTVKTEEPSEGF